jgi:hypothetical protein
MLIGMEATGMDQILLHPKEYPFPQNICGGISQALWSKISGF